MQVSHIAQIWYFYRFWHSKTIGKTKNQIFIIVFELLAKECEKKVENSNVICLKNR